ncbi:hypothetical protein ACP4OV_026902 [Aristida adscensionis]
MWLRQNLGTKLPIRFDHPKSGSTDLLSSCVSPHSPLADALNPCPPLLLALNPCPPRRHTTPTLSLSASAAVFPVGMSPGSSKTASRCTTEGVQGKHVFEIVGYSLKKGIGVGKFFQSSTFTVGGYDWAIRFYPDGRRKASQVYISVCLQLVSENAELRACYSLKLVSQDPWKSYCEWGTTLPRLFKSCDSTKFGPQSSKFMLRSELETEGSCYVRHDCLTIECDLTVVRESQFSDIRFKYEIEVPPCDISAHYAKLLDQKYGADVTFLVGGLPFAAHKVVLAARSPVFKAGFYGQMREKRMHHVTIKDMQPDVFRALLHYIYTGSLHDLDDLHGNNYSDMVWNLLAAADRYAMDRLKLICQSILSKNLNVENVATTLALADKHYCDRLKEVCIEFITSPKEMNAVLATRGYSNLKRTCPYVLSDLFEKTSRSHRK